MINLKDKFIFLVLEDRFQNQSGTSTIPALEISMEEKFFCDRSHHGNSGPSWQDPKPMVSS